MDAAFSIADVLLWGWVILVIAIPWVPVKSVRFVFAIIGTAILAGMILWWVSDAQWLGWLAWIRQFPWVLVIVLGFFIIGFFIPYRKPEK